MTTDGPGQVDRTWRVASSAEALQLVAEGVATFAGFRIATVLIVDGDELECVAAAGTAAPDGALGSRAPKKFLATPWTPRRSGVCCATSPTRISTPRRSPTATSPMSPSATIPTTGIRSTACVLPVYGADGDLCARAVDRRPLGRPVPDRSNVDGWRIYSVARRSGDARPPWSRKSSRSGSRWPAAARRVVRAASGALSLVEVLDRSRTALLDGFAADELWWRLLTVPESSRPSGAADVDRGPARAPSTDPGHRPGRGPGRPGASRRSSWRVPDCPCSPLRPTTPRSSSSPRSSLPVSDIGSLLVIPLGHR